MIKLKREYLNFSVSVAGFKKRKFHDIHESEFQKYFDAGFTEFFEVVEEKPLKKEKTLKTEDFDYKLPELKIDEENDTDK